MKRSHRHDTAADYAAKIKACRAPKYQLRLYVTGVTPRSLQAIESIKHICETHLKGRYKLKVVDVYQQPELAKKEQILAAPTLIKLLPKPLRRFIGDMAKKDRILLGLNIQPSPEES